MLNSYQSRPNRAAPIIEVCTFKVFPRLVCSIFTYSIIIHIDLGKVESTKLAPLNGGVLVEYVESHENLLKTIGLDPLPAAFFDGTLLHSEFKFPENASEKDIEKKLLEIINSKRNIDTGEGRPLLHCQAYNQVKTFDGGILDIIVFDELIGLEDAGAPISSTSLVWFIVC